MDPAAAASRLLLNQLRDIAGQMLTLTERLGLLIRELEGVDHTQRGARNDVQRGMPPAGFPTFNEAVMLALRAEQELAEMRARERVAYPGPTEGPVHKRPRTESDFARVAGAGPRPFGRPCPICVGAHQVTECPWRYDHCYRCGRPGHNRYHCPWKPGVTRPPAPRTRGTERTATPVPQGDPARGDRGRGPPKGARKEGQAPAEDARPPQGPCVICQGAHPVAECTWRYHYCNQCGLPDHTQDVCPQRPAAAAPMPPPQKGADGAAAPVQPRDPPDDQEPSDPTDSSDSSDVRPLPRHAVRRWPRGCGRTPRDTAAGDATSQT